MKTTVHLLSPRQACTQLGISMRELRTLKHNGHAPESFNITPRTVRYLSTSVDHFHTTTTPGEQTIAHT